jgi:TonB family protein
MAQPPPSKHLRVALIQGAKITEDRTLKRRTSVSVGQSATNTFVVPVSNLPPSFTLFELVNGVYYLTFTAKMEGKVSVKGVDVSLQQARAQGLAKPRKDLFVLPLTDASKGRVALGEVSLLFQFVTPAPEPPKPELPPHVRGFFFDSTDRLFFAILGISLLVHFSGATFIAMQPMPVEHEVSLEELPDRFLKTMMPQERPPPPKTEVAAGNEKKDDKKDEGKDAKKDSGKTTSNADAKAELAAKVAKSGLLKVIGSGSGGSGAFEDVLGGSSGVGDVASALSGASGVGVATSDALGAGGPKGGTSGSAAGIGDLGTSGGGNVNLREKEAAQVRGGVSMQTPEIESADVDREKLSAYVRGRKSAIQQCYEKELKRNPTLKGKVVVRFTITTSGRASEIDIEENSLGNEAVAACIKTVIRGWVFPFKPPSEVPVAYPFVFAPAN